jgi:hypothetical protein
VAASTVIVVNTNAIITITFLCLGSVPIIVALDVLSEDRDCNVEFTVWEPSIMELTILHYNVSIVRGPKIRNRGPCNLQHFIVFHHLKLEVIFNLDLKEGFWDPWLDIDIACFF